MERAYAQWGKGMLKLATSDAPAALEAKALLAERRRRMHSLARRPSANDLVFAQSVERAQSGHINPATPVPYFNQFYGFTNSAKAAQVRVAAQVGVTRHSPLGSRSDGRTVLLCVGFNLYTTSIYTH